MMHARMATSHASELTLLHARVSSTRKRLTLFDPVRSATYRDTDVVWVNEEKAFTLSVLLLIPSGLRLSETQA